MVAEDRETGTHRALWLPGALRRNRLSRGAAAGAVGRASVLARTLARRGEAGRGDTAIVLG